MDREDERRRDISRKYRNRRIVENKSPNNDLPELKKKIELLKSCRLIRSFDRRISEERIFRKRDLKTGRKNAVSKERDPVDTRATIRVIRTGLR